VELYHGWINTGNSALRNTKGKTSLKASAARWAGHKAQCIAPIFSVLRVNIMGTAILDMPSNAIPPFEVSAIGALDAAATRSEFRDDETLIQNLISVLDRHLLNMIGCRNSAEFDQSRDKIWPRYVRSRRALSDTLTGLFPSTILEFWSKSSEERLRSDLEQARNRLFGDSVVDQTLFSIWIMSKMRAISHAISESGEPRSKDEDLKLGEDFRIFLIWGQFHFDCVVAAIKFQRVFAKDVEYSICDGLKAWVNASAIMEEALALRTTKTDEYPNPDSLPWDEEDECLLSSSMKDMDEQPSDGF